MSVLYALKRRRRDQTFPRQHQSRPNTPTDNHQSTTYVKFTPKIISQLSVLISS